MIEKQETYNTIEEAENSALEEMKNMEQDIAKNEAINMELNESNMFEFNCMKFKQLNDSIDKLSTDYNRETEGIRLQINALQKQLDKIKTEKYTEILNTLNAEKEKLKEDILDNWTSDTKTEKFDFGSFTKRSMKTAKVTDQELLIQDLTQKGLLNKAIKMFDKSKLKSWFEDEVIDKGIEVNESFTLVFKAKK